MRRDRPVWYLSLAVFLTAGSLFGAATVVTDQQTYVPTQTVTITGAGFQPLETVTLRIDENPDTDGDSPIIWTVVADPTGGFTDSSFVVNAADAGVTFTLTATGQSSGFVAQTTFSDAPNVSLKRSASTYTYSFTYQDFTSNNCTTGGGTVKNGSVTTNGGDNIGATSGSVLIVANLNADSPANWVFQGWTTLLNGSGTLSPIISGQTICIPSTFNGNAFITANYGAGADSGFQTRYAANLNIGESYIDIQNTGANGDNAQGPGFGTLTGNICVNVYAFDPNEELIACCSCLVTPDQTVNLGVNANLVSKTLTGVVPTSVTIKLIATAPAGTSATSGGNCTNSAAGTGTPASLAVINGMAAWGTTLHGTPTAGSDATSETAFTSASPSASELQSIAGRCSSIIGNASGFGICSTCRTGALGGAKI